MNPDDVNQVDSQPNEYTTKLRDETRLLMNMLSNDYRANNLTDMLHGAWATLNTTNNNPDFLAQVAHSIREFMEKAHDYIVEAPVKQEGNGLKGAVISLTDKWTSATQNTKTISTSDWSGTVDNPFQKILKALGEFFATFSAEHRPRGAQHRAVMATLDSSGQPIPEIIMKERLKLWNELDDFFKEVAHHKKTTNKEELQVKIISLEDFLLVLKYPERALPIETLNTLEDIIAEGDAV